MSKSLANIVRASNEIIEHIIESGGELSPELEKELLDVQVGLPAKIDQYAYMLEKLKTETNFWLEKATELDKIAGRCERLMDDLKKRLKAAAVDLNVSELKGKTKVIQVSNGKSSLHIEGELENKYYRFEQLRVCDMEMVRKDLAAGIEIPGVTQVPTKTLKIKVNKEVKK